MLIPHLLSHFLIIHVITTVDIRINSCMVWQSTQKAICYYSEILHLQAHVQCT